MRLKRLSHLLSDRPILGLVFCSLAFYALKTYDLEDSFKSDNENCVPVVNESFAAFYSALPYRCLYIEIATVGYYPVVIKLKDYEDLELISSHYNLPRKPRNGDKLIENSNSGIFEISRMSGKKSLTLGIPIGINSAQVEDLVELPGIGNTLARSIVELRNVLGGFKAVDELLGVRGIGRKKLEAIEERINLD